MVSIKHYLFDWGNTLMGDLPGQAGPMWEWPGIEAMPNALEALRRLSRRTPCHLATNARDSEPEQIREALRRVGLDGYISKIFCFRAVGHPKPSAQFFDHICRELNCAAADLVMVGDDLERDVMGAKEYGLGAVWYNPRSEPGPEGVKQIRDLMQLAEAKEIGGVETPP